MRSVTAIFFVRLRRGLPLRACVLALLLTPGSVAAFLAGATGDGDLERGRAIYAELEDAARDGDWIRFERLREQLGGYPLAPYADYRELVARLQSTPGTRARTFVDAHGDSPIGVRYLGHYLRAAGRDRRWGDLLAAAQDTPNSERLRCYYARAKRGRGQEDEAWALARQLFLSPSSVDEACDPLFRLWRSSGGLTGDVVWERAKLAFAARESGLLRYVASLGGPREALGVLLQVYRNPHRSAELTASLPAPYRGEILVLGIERHSRYDPERALAQYRGADTGLLDARQKARIERAIAFRALIERDEGVRAWIDAQLPRWQDADLAVLRLRWAIREEDWQTIRDLAAAVPEHERGDGVWLYWRGRAAEEAGREAEAQALFAAAADERSYYGFLSADRASLPYSFDEAPLSPLAPSAEAQLPERVRAAAWRVHELNALQEPRLAHSEWAYTLQRADRDSQLALAQLAGNEGWHRLAIDAAIAGRAWDALEVRFPLAYTDAFRERASRQSVPVSELMAIARRESAFFPSARSAVGARGLMQLMPATGAAVAREAGMRLDVRQLYDVERNLDLGSAYYRQLLDRFDGNRAVALAAYNAGPNRVKHWVGEGLPVDAWIETIPYRETRDYVKAVLAYSVVFDYRLGQSAQLLSRAERSARY